MKTLGRVLIILAFFALVMGITYVTVTATASSNPGGMPVLERGERPQLSVGEQPEFPDADRDEFRGGGWVFGAIKNIGIVSIIVLLIVLPKGWLQKRRRKLHLSGA